MATRAVNIDGDEHVPVEDIGLGDILFLAFPKATYKALSDEAAKRGHTLAQALQLAIDGYLKKGGNNG